MKKDMDMKEVDGIVKGIVSAAIIGLFVWVMNINATVKVDKVAAQAGIAANKAEISHGASERKEYKEAMKDLTVAIQELKIYLARERK